MAFDPDAYLAEKAAPQPAQQPQKTGFDPDTYLAQKSPAVASGLAPKSNSIPGMVDLTPSQRAIAALLGPVGLGAAITGKSLPLESVKSMALNSGGAIAGAELGALGGPAAPVTVPVGAVLGAMGGNLLDQSTRPGQTGIKKGELLASGITGYLPAASSIGAGGMALAKEALKAGARGALAKAAETGIDEGRLPTAGEALTATALPAIGGAAAGRAQQLAPEMQSAVAAAEAPGAVQRYTLEAGKKLGLVVPVSEVNPSFANNTLEGVAGGTAVRQEASKINQKVVNDATRDYIGASKEDPINLSTLNRIRKEAGSAYEDVGKLSDDKSTIEALRTVNPDYADTVENARQNLKELIATREEMNGYYKEANGANHSYDALQKARAAESRAESLEDELAKAAAYSGKAQVYDNLVNARARIAKTYTVQKALNTGNGDVSALDLANALNKGVPMEGDLRTIAEFANAFPSAVKDSTKTGMAGVSKMDFGLGALSAALAGTASHDPLVGVAGAALPALTSFGARKTVLSSPYQNLFARVPSGPVNANPSILAQIIQEAGQSAGQNRN